jgi:hypothetical protein
MTGTGGIFLIAFAVFILYAIGYYMRLKNRLRKNNKKWQDVEERQRMEEAARLEAMLAEIDIRDMRTH